MNLIVIFRLNYVILEPEIKYHNSEVRHLVK